MLLGLGLVLLYRAPTDEREGKLVGVLLLPAAYIRQQRVAGAAARVCKERHHRLTRRAQGFEGEGLAVEAREAELRGRRAHRKAFCLVDGGAVLGWRYATARTNAFLQGLQAYQQTPVLPQQMHEERPLSSQEGEYDYPAQESQQLGSRKRSEPGDSAASGTAIGARPQDEASHGCERPIAG